MNDVYDVCMYAHVCSCMSCVVYVACILHVVRVWRALIVERKLCTSKNLQVCLLYFTVFGPNDLPTGVHAHCWLLSTQLHVHMMDTSKIKIDNSCTNSIINSWLY